MAFLQPVLFIGHGSPMNAIAENEFTHNLVRLGCSLPKPSEILVISAHWETIGTRVLSVDQPQTIHDFYGFPKELFDVQYKAPCAISLAKQLHSLDAQIRLDHNWGFDHGAWSILVHLFPNADIPVTQLSIDKNKSFEEHLELGKKLASLRKENVLILASGNIVHNLALIQWKNKNSGEPWATEFDEIIRASLENHNENILIEIDKLGEVAELSVPTPEHYIPLLYAYGASSPSDIISYPHQGYEFGSLSMRSVMWSS